MKDDHRADFDGRMEEWVGVNPDLGNYKFRPKTFPDVFVTLLEMD